MNDWPCGIATACRIIAVFTECVECVCFGEAMYLALFVYAIGEGALVRADKVPANRIDNVRGRQ